MTKFLGEQGLSELVSKIRTSLSNYYTSSQVYTKAEVDAIASAIPKFDIKVVSALPTENISTSTIYLLTSGQETQNLYDEYIRINKGTTENPNWAWEKLGTQSVDLSGYSTTAQMNTAISTALASYYTKTETDTLLSAKASATDVTNLANNTTKIKNSSGGFAAGESASCSGLGAAIGETSSATSGAACGFGATATSGGAVGAGAEATTGFAGGLNAKATADGAVQLGTGTNSTANTLKFRDLLIVRSDQTIETVNLRYGTISANTHLPVTGNDIYVALSNKQNTLSFDSSPTQSSSNPVTSGGVYTALSSKQDTMTEITTAEVDALFT